MYSGKQAARCEVSSGALQSPEERIWADAGPASSQGKGTQHVGERLDFEDGTAADREEMCSSKSKAPT